MISPFSPLDVFSDGKFVFRFGNDALTLIRTTDDAPETVQRIYIANMTFMQADSLTMGWCENIFSISASPLSLAGVEEFCNHPNKCLVVPLEPKKIKTSVIHNADTPEAVAAARFFSQVWAACKPDAGQETTNSSQGLIGSLLRVGRRKTSETAQLPVPNRAVSTVTDCINVLDLPKTGNAYRFEVSGL